MIFVKVFLSILAAFVALFGGFIACLMTAFSGNSSLYIWSVGIAFAVLLFIVLCWTWAWFQKKRRIIISLGLVGILAISFAGLEINKWYHENIDTVNEQGVNLNLYKPFLADTKAVSLDEPATLKFESDPPKIDGATALYPLYSAFARATYPEKDYHVDVNKVDDIVVCSNTVGSYQRLISGEADIIFAAAPSDEQQQMAKDNGIELVMTPIGREAFVFFVNAKNPVSNLSTNDIQSIYSGEITNWKNVGGKNKSIRAFQRPENSGSQTMLIKIMGETQLMTPPLDDIIDAMGGIIDRVSAYKNYDNSLGYSFLFFATEMVNDNKIKLLSVNDIAPTRENVANGTYPYAAEFFAVTAGKPDESSQKLIDWILSEQGQEIVAKTGYTPIE